MNEINLPLKRLVYEISATSPLQLHKTLPTITLRGAFGYSLLQVLARDETLCDFQEKATIYKNLFYPDGTKENTRNSSPARPFVMRGYYTRPDNKSFLLEMILIGEACDAEPLVDTVITNMARMGLGKNQQKCDCVKVHSENVVPVGLPEFCPQILVHFQSPTIIKHQKMLCLNDIPFTAVIHRLIDRINELGNAFGNNWHNIDPRPYLKEAQAIESTVLELHQEHNKRRSTRTGQKMQIDGVTGGIIYQGHLAPFSNILKFLPWLHIGKSTPFGCGWCSIEVFNNQT